MAWTNFSFQRRYKWQKEGGHNSFDITVVFVSCKCKCKCKCKEYDWEHPLLFGTSMCYQLTRTCQVAIIILCEVHSQIKVNRQLMSPIAIGVKRWQMSPLQLTTIIVSYWFVYDCSIILANTLFMIVLL